MNAKQNTITNPITGTGTATKLAKFTSAGVIEDSVITESASGISVTGDITALTKIKSSSSDIILEDSSGIAFRGVRATSFADSVPTRFFQIGDVGDNVAFTAKNGSRIQRTLISSYLTQITSTSYNTTNVPSGIFEVSNGTQGLFNVFTNGNIKNSGLHILGQYTTATRPAYVKGSQFFDTTINKMVIGGATAWEDVTSS